MKSIAKKITKAFKSGNKLLICGNGGSAAQAQHMAAELVGKYRHKRKALPAIALTTDSSILTAVGNDYGFRYVFGRQIEALGKPGDILLTISTSGKSENVLWAEMRAKSLGLEVIKLPIEGSKTPYIQEMHLVMLHEICQLVEEEFLENRNRL